MLRNCFKIIMICIVLFAARAIAEDIITVKKMTLELANDVAREAILACREKGYQVSVVVVDRGANVQTVMRDTLAARFTTEIAERKANAVVMSGVSSAEFRKNRADIKAEMNEVTGILVLDGGVPIQAAGSMLGAVGVSGAPGGDIDEDCALKGIEKVQERLDFAE